jgi:hypothetical protein
MRINLDENIGNRGVELLRLAGHDVMTVPDQGLQGARDETLFDICAGEGRILVTRDHDFGQVLRFPPRTQCGSGHIGTWIARGTAIVVGQASGVPGPGRGAIAECCLWIVEPGRVRVHLRDGN